MKTAPDSSPKRWREGKVKKQQAIERLKTVKGTVKDIRLSGRSLNFNRHAELSFSLTAESGESFQVFASINALRMCFHKGLAENYVITATLQRFSYAVNNEYELIDYERTAA